VNWDLMAAEWRQLKARLRRLWGKAADPSGAASGPGPVPTLNRGVTT
jgi:hypothetical protein